MYKIGDPIPDRTEQVAALIARFFPDDASYNGASDRPAEDLIEAFPELGRIARHEGKPPKDDSASGWDFYLACGSARSELTMDEFAALLRLARNGDKKSRRDDYVKRTWEKAQERVAAEEIDPATRISKRWGLAADPVVSGRMRDPIVYLTLRSGRELRLPNVDDLFEPNKHSRIVSRVAKTRFPRLAPAEAVDIAQRVIELCPSEEPDPLEDARQWVIEFNACAGAIVKTVKPDGKRIKRWDVFEEVVRIEQTLKATGSDVARRSVVIYDSEKDEAWLPAGALKKHSDARLPWPEFTACLAEIGWRHAEIDMREPDRAKRAAHTAKRFRRRFYVGGH